MTLPARLCILLCTTAAAPLFVLSGCESTVRSMSSGKTFTYFAYGSNLLARRIHVRNPSAVRRGIGRLDDYRLDFNRFSERWGGCAATIVPDAGSHVWGALWDIDASRVADLDEQEGVTDKVYEPVTVSVAAPGNDSSLRCRVYQLTDLPEAYAAPALLPAERRPSRIYLETILQGCVESGLPDDYLRFLQSFPHNGYEGPVQVPGLDLQFSLTRDE